MGNNKYIFSLSEISKLNPEFVHKFVHFGKDNKNDNEPHKKNQKKAIIK
jgi:hypothetical protein